VTHRTVRRSAAGILAAVALLLAAGPAPAAGPDLEAIRKKAETCLACHGPDGNSIQPAIPTLAWQPKHFITTQLVMYHEGRRINPLMAPFTTNMTSAAQPLSASDIDLLADYLASLH
jgi:cytochrome c553